MAYSLKAEYNLDYIPQAAITSSVYVGTNNSVQWSCKMIHMLSNTLKLFLVCIEVAMFLSQAYVLMCTILFLLERG